MQTAGFRGLAIKKALWRAAKATAFPDFKEAMKRVADIDPKCKEWLEEKLAQQWSKSHFTTCVKSDMLLNNICILESKQKPILTMMEWVRQYLMSILQENRDMAERKREGKKICPKIRIIVDSHESKSCDCIPIKSTDWVYQLDCSGGDRHIVNMKDRTCRCKKWDLTEIPCKHACSELLAQGHQLVDFVDECYSCETYANVYEVAINPISGPNLWDRTGYIPPLPPNFGKRKRGRPVRERRMGAGHNQRTCEWKKLAKSGLQDGAFDMGAEAEELTQGDEFPSASLFSESNNIKGSKKKALRRLLLQHMVVASFDLSASFELGFFAFFIFFSFASRVIALHVTSWFHLLVDLFNATNQMAGDEELSLC
ncbi:mutator transposable element-related protein [Striga asiatica]|uniref:Mutator transposable element-related protein n=1 Tax=Striga asiatica TaxID=4170 RepID=A0A5A7QI93_STRAF|nr:mutator transposable element-related protein [Striga asiatica]